jgi:Flp pilus assembly pilin Flp
MLNKIKAFLKNETGAETLEYIVIAGVIITLGAAAYSGAGISGLITNIFGTLSGLVTAAS